MVIKIQTGTFFQSRTVLLYLYYFVEDILMNKFNVRYLTIAGIFAAIVCVVTTFLRVPVPMGYVNFGNSVILIFSCFITLKYGIFAGTIGSALSDLFGYPIWILPTLIIKGAMTVAFYGIRKIPCHNQKVITIIAACVSMLIPIIGYYFAGAILYNGLRVSLAQLPSLIVEYGANCALFIAAYLGLSNTPLATLMDIERK